MKPLRNFLMTACLITAGLLFGCSEMLGARARIIHIEGVTWACNVTTSYAAFGTTIENENEREVMLYASTGDLLYMMMDDLPFYYRYNPRDGNQLKVTFDTLNAVVAYLNGEPEYLELNGPSSLNALNQWTHSEIEKLSALSIKGPLSNDLFNALQKHGTALSGIGLILEGVENSGELSDLLSICHPRLLVMDDSWSFPGPYEDEVLSDLELLWIQGEGREISKLVQACRNLESMIIEGWDPAAGELLALSGLQKLQSLTMAESPVTTLTEIAFPSSLRHLFMIHCDSLSDVSALAELPGLQRLGLSGCKVEDPGPLKKLVSLRWLSFPSNVSQIEFREMTGLLTKLEVVEMLECSEIENLSPLQPLRKLRIVMLKLEKEQLAMLESLDQLDMMILASELFEADPQWIKELRLELPECKIVPGSGLCLGSGWILMLFPFILMFRLLFRQKNRASL